MEAPSDILSLPASLFGKISEFLPDCSLFELRKASQLGDEKVCSLIGTLGVHFNGFILKPVDASETQFVFKLGKRDSILWIVCVLSVMRKVGIEFAKSFMPTLGVTDLRNNVSFSLMNDEVPRLFDALKPLVQRSRFCNISNHGSLHAHPDIIRACANFMEDKSIHFLEIQPGFNNDASPWLYFHHKLRCDQTIITVNDMPKSVKVLICQFANVSKMISMYRSSSHFFSDFKVEIVLVQEILSRKCHHLVFGCGFKISYAEVEKQLINILHHLPKQVYLRGHTNEGRMNAQFGNYEEILRQMSALLFLFLPLIATVQAIDTESCGKTKDCLFQPPGCSLLSCDYFLSLSSLDEWTTFELATTNITQGTNYLALGLSDDEVMGEEPVTFCHFPSDSTPTVNVGLNEGKSNRVADPAHNGIIKENVEMLHAEKKDSTLFCSFRQRIAPTSQHEMLPPLNKKFTLFIVRGKGMPQLLGIHELNPSSKDFPFISPSSINLTRFFPQAAPPNDTVEVTTELSSTTPVPTASAGLFDFSPASRLWMIRIHGILMLVPWLSLIPSAILAARYLRQEWTAYSPGGLHIWFHLHRSLNYFSFFLLIVSTLLVLTAKNFRWTGPWWNKAPGKLFGPGSIHSGVGAIAVVGVLLQVLGALIRPSPDSKLRPFFNTFHRAVGFIALLNALVATIIAANFFVKYWSDKWAALLLCLLAAFLIIIAFILFMVEDRLATRKRTEEIEMTAGTAVSVTTVHPARKRWLRKGIFIVFFVISLALSVYIVLHLIV